MKKYYTRVCNFYYGNTSKKLIKQKKTLPLNGNPQISFDHIEKKIFLILISTIFPILWLY